MVRLKRNFFALLCGLAVAWGAAVNDSWAAVPTCDVIREHVDAVYPEGHLLWKGPLSYRVDYNYTGTPLPPVDRTVEAYLKVFQGYSGLELVKEPKGSTIPKFRVIVATDFAKTLKVIRPTYQGPVNEHDKGKYQQLIERAAKGDMTKHIVLVAQRGEILHALVLINPLAVAEADRKAFIIENVMRGLLFSKADSTAIGPSIFAPGLLKDEFYMLPGIDLELMDAMYDPRQVKRDDLVEKFCAQLKAGDEP